MQGQGDGAVSKVPATHTWEPQWRPSASHRRAWYGGAHLQQQQCGGMGPCSSLTLSTSMFQDQWQPLFQKIRWRDQGRHLMSISSTISMCVHMWACIHTHTNTHCMCVTPHDSHLHHTYTVHTGTGSLSVQVLGPEFGVPSAHIQSWLSEAACVCNPGSGEIEAGTGTGGPLGLAGQLV